MDEPSVASRCFAMSGLFESELLVELMLRFWKHPFADDKAFRSDLLENAVEVLKLSIAGQKLFEHIEPENVNLVLALWYVEWSNITSEHCEQKNDREKWADALKRAVPSCFCDPDLLD